MGLSAGPAPKDDGQTCRKGDPNCYCKVGWPYDKQCPKCRDLWKPGQFRDSYCVCPPDESCAWCGSSRPAAPSKCPNCGGPRMIIDRRGALAIDLETTGLTSKPKPRPPVSETR